MSDPTTAQGQPAPVLPPLPDQKVDSRRIHIRRLIHRCWAESAPGADLRAAMDQVDFAIDETMRAYARTAVAKVGAALQDMTDDRDSWCEQANARTADAVQFGAERDQLSAELAAHQQALALLCGLCTEVTAIEPTAVAQAIFDHVLAEVAILKRQARESRDMLERFHLDNARRHIPAAAPVLKPQVGACEWTLDTDFWQSACGEAWSFNDGGPVENSVRFCQGCGKPVVLDLQPEGGADHG